MARISVNHLTFGYEGSFDDVFEDVSFTIDTNWKLGFIGRNGKGKTTFLKLLMGGYEYRGSISTSVVFDYFPYQISAKDQKRPAAEFLEERWPECESWRVVCELDKLQVSAEVLYRPWETLSFGERTKVMLAILCSRENHFLLIDEPTNHLDQATREMIRKYLKSKKGFILVSHDRDLLDDCTDHVLVLNRSTIEVQSGNFSTWWENKTRRDSFEAAENEKHKREISKLRETARRSRSWADKNESTKIGFDPKEMPEHNIGTRPYIAAKTKKMQARVTQYERRMEREIAEKEGLLRDVEQVENLKLLPMHFHKEVFVETREYSLAYPGDGCVLTNLTMAIRQGSRVFLDGKNGCGKSSLIKAILAHQRQETYVCETGTLRVASGLIISYVNQDTSYLQGTLQEFCKCEKLEETLVLALLRKLDMERTQFAKPMEEFSEGQKKKVLLAASLARPAHLYIWDEPLNYIDVFSRMQIETLLLKFQPTMLLVEHDMRFREKIATEVISL